jgi:hypothetical protein
MESGYSLQQAMENQKRMNEIFKKRESDMLDSFSYATFKDPPRFIEPPKEPPEGWKTLLGLGLDKAIVRNPAQDMVPAQAMREMEAENKRYRQETADLRIKLHLAQDELAHERDERRGLRPQKPLLAVVECAMRYVKVQSRRYQLDLLAAIDAMERNRGCLKP